MSEPGEAAARRATGLLVWLLVCAGYLALELTGWVDGLALPVPLILALAVARAAEGRRWARPLAGAAAAAAIVAALAVSRAQLVVLDIAPSMLALGLGLTGAIAALALVRRVRRTLLPPLGLDPASAVHTVTAIAAVLTLIFAVLAFVALQSEMDEEVPLYASEPLVSLLGDGALALAGVGFLLSRGPAAARARLDLRPLRMRALVGALLAAVVFHGAMALMEYAEGIALPEIHAREDRFHYEFVNLPPLVGAVLVSIAAGVGEELVFRGALQPRLGVILTSLLFAAVHVQYQVPGMVMIFLMGVGLGLLKRRTSTTFTACVHVFYDIGAFLLPD